MKILIPLNQEPFPNDDSAPKKMSKISVEDVTVSLNNGKTNCQETLSNKWDAKCDNQDSKDIDVDVQITNKKLLINGANSLEKDAVSANDNKEDASADEAEEDVCADEAEEKVSMDEAKEDVSADEAEEEANMDEAEDKTRDNIFDSTKKNLCLIDVSVSENELFSTIEKSKFPLVSVEALKKEVVEHYMKYFCPQIQSRKRKKVIEVVDLVDDVTDSDDDVIILEDGDNDDIKPVDIKMVSDISKSKFPILLLKPLKKKDLAYWKVDSVTSFDAGEKNLTKVVKIKQELENEGGIRSSLSPVVVLRPLSSKIAISDKVPPMKNEKNIYKTVFKCNKCEYCSDSSWHAIAHSVTHTDSKLFKCKKCSAGDNRRTRILSHLKNKHNLDHERAERNYVKLKHVEEQGRKYIYTVFRCLTCRFETKESSEINNHHHSSAYIKEKRASVVPPRHTSLTAVKGIKPLLKDTKEKAHKMFETMFQCCVCNYETGIKRNARRHSLTHSKFKTFRCSMCEFGANKEGPVKIHLLKEHGKECSTTAKRNSNILNQDAEVAANTYFSQYIIKVLKCLTCNYETEDITIAERHITIHSENKLESYNCWECEYDTDSKASLCSHLKKHPNFKCIENQKVSNKDDSINEVIVSLFHCSSCGLKTKNRYHAMRHSLYHADFRLYKCSQCDFDTNRKYQITEHVEVKHDITADSEDRFISISDVDTAKTELFNRIISEIPLRSFVCTLCEYESEARSDAETHFLIHSDGKFYNCTDCVYRTTDKSKIRLHLDGHKRGNTPSSTEEVTQSKKRVKLNAQETHNTTSSSQISLSCSKCSFTTIDECSLANHSCSSEIYREIFKCLHCSFTSRYKQNMRRHEQSFHSKDNFETEHKAECEELKCMKEEPSDVENMVVSPSIALKCSKCSFETVNKSSFISHFEQTHCGVKRFKCSECFYESYSNSHLSAHMKVIHSDVKLKEVFTCSQCDYSTSLERNLTKHLKAHSRVESESKSSSVEDQEEEEEEDYQERTDVLGKRIGGNRPRGITNYREDSDDQKEESTDHKEDSYPKKEDFLDHQEVSDNHNKDDRQESSHDQSYPQKEDSSDHHQEASDNQKIDSVNHIIENDDRQESTHDQKEKEESVNHNEDSIDHQDIDNSDDIMEDFVECEEGTDSREKNTASEEKDGIINLKNDTDSSTERIKTLRKRSNTNEMNESDDEDLATDHQKKNTRRSSTFTRKKRVSSRVRNMKKIESSDIIKDNDSQMGISDTQGRTPDKRSDIVNEDSIDNSSSGPKCSVTSTDENSRESNSCSTTISDKGKFKCETCGFETKYRYSLQRHQRMHFKPESVVKQVDSHYHYKCSDDDDDDDDQSDDSSNRRRVRKRKYRTQDTSNNKRNKNNNEKIISDDNQNNSDDSHKRINDNKVSDDSRTRINDNNQKTVSDNRQVNKLNVFKCSECSYETHLKATLTRHMRNHSSVKSFKCLECDFAVGDRMLFTSHVNNHVISKSEGKNSFISSQMEEGRNDSENESVEDHRDEEDVAQELDKSEDQFEGFEDCGDQGGEGEDPVENVGDDDDEVEDREDQDEDFRDDDVEGFGNCNDGESLVEDFGDPDDEVEHGEDFVHDENLREDDENFISVESIVHVEELEDEVRYTGEEVMEDDDNEELEIPADEYETEAYVNDEFVGLPNVDFVDCDLFDSD